MAKTPEKKVKDKITAVLKAAGVYYFYPVAGGYGNSGGVPDIVACYKGRFIGIEVKADIKKSGPTALQLANLKAISDNGGMSMVLDGNNWELIHNVLGQEL